MKKPTKKMTRDDVANIFRNAAEQAEDFVTESIAPDRIKAARYAAGYCDVTVEKDPDSQKAVRNSVVVPTVRNVVRQIKPSLLRVFMASDKPVEFVPRRPDAVAAAEQATDFAAYQFQRLGGFKMLSDVMDDALYKKCGVLKVWWDEREETEVDRYEGLTPEQVELLAAAEDVEITEQSVDETGLVAITATRINKRGDIAMKPIPPEKFFVDKDATDLTDAYVVGHREDMRVGDLVAMGYDFEEVLEHAGSWEDSEEEEEDFVRNGQDNDDETHQLDPSMRLVTVTEGYMRMDVEGTGKPRLYRILAIGSKRHVLEYEPADFVPFAVFESDPVAHTFFGSCPADMTIERQDIETSLTRELLDSIKRANNPDAVVIESGIVDYDQVQSRAIGRLIDVREPGAYQELPPANITGNILPAMQYLNEQTESITGVRGASLGLNADALQSTTASGVQAAVQQAEGQVEVIARHLAEGGMVQLWRLFIQIIRQNPQPDMMMRVNGAFVPVDPQSWHSDMDVIVNVGLGTGQRQEKMMALMASHDRQAMVLQQLGPGNPLVSLTNFRATEAAILRHAGVHDVDKHWKPLTDEQEQQMLAAQQQAAAQAPDPNAALIQMEMQKAQIAAQSRLQEAAMKMQHEQTKELLKQRLEYVKAASSDDRERDKMVQDLILQVADLYGKYAIQVPTEQVMAAQAAPRPYG